ncbi:hypothetical protein Ciccas_003780 [Cichlidogyrus casuarinus]|uniref:G-protein coupled receptors family 2 profile 2 domain-containing protein n=1 Tax=Cichlidogyrus casuarinus TaxID=1844966 RepID=A0ABD2QDE8_9PLAT
MPFFLHTIQFYTVFVFSALFYCLHSEDVLFDGPQRPVKNCHKEVQKCQLAKETCFGFDLPYTKPHNPHFDDDIRYNNVSFFSPFKAIPNCWPKLRIYLCATHFPDCADDFITLPDLDMCEDLHKVCPLSILPKLPRFLNCSQYSAPCAINPLRQRYFQSGHSDCPSELVSSTNSDRWVRGIDHCAYPCTPLYLTRNDQRIAYYSQIVLLCLVATLCAFLLFYNYWTGRMQRMYFIKQSNYLLVLAFICCVGYLFSLLSDASCDRDQTLRREEPRENSFYCLLSFILLYPTVIYSVLWLGNLFFAVFHLTELTLRSQSLSRFRSMNRYLKISIFLICAFLTALALALNLLEGEPVSGFCFLGYNSLSTRISFLWLPVFVSLFLQILAFALTFWRWPRMKRQHPRRRNKDFIFYSIVYILLIVSCTLSAFSYDLYRILYEPLWLEQHRISILCRMRQRLLGLSEESAILSCTTGKSLLQFSHNFSMYHIPEEFGVMETYFVPFFLHKLGFFLLPLVAICLQLPLRVNLLWRKQATNEETIWWDPGYLSLYDEYASRAKKEQLKLQKLKAEVDASTDDSLEALTRRRLVKRPARRMLNNSSSSLPVATNSRFMAEDTFLNVPVTKPSSVDTSSLQTRGVVERAFSDLSMFSAKSYNSYQLLTSLLSNEQKEKLRTYQVFQNVLDWANLKAHHEVGRPEQLNQQYAPLSSDYAGVDPVALERLSQAILAQNKLDTQEEREFALEAAYKAAYATLLATRSDIKPPQSVGRLEEGHSDSFDSEDDQQSCSSDKVE